MLSPGGEGSEAAAFVPIAGVTLRMADSWQGCRLVASLWASGCPWLLTCGPAWMSCEPTAGAWGGVKAVGTSHDRRFRPRGPDSHRDIYVESHLSPSQPGSAPPCPESQPTAAGGWEGHLLAQNPAGARGTRSHVHRDCGTFHLFVGLK